MPTAPPLRFDEHCREAVLGLRGALLDLYQAVGADPARPQDVARRFRLNKNLTWKVARIIQTEDAFAAVPLIPGAAGFEILLDAMSAAGAPIAAAERVRTAAQAFDEMIETHTGDRATLELALDSMGAERPLEMSRKLAFRGNSGIWGIQAGVRVTAQFLAPNAKDPALLDTALVGGLTRVRRLRPVPRWPMFQIVRYNDDGTTPREVQPEPIDERESDDAWLLRSFCDGAMPEIHIAETTRGHSYELGDGPVGRTGEFTCFFGYSERGVVPRYRDEHNQFGELYSTISIPSETLLFDLFVQRELAEALGPAVELHGRLWGQTGADTPASRLPCAHRVLDLGRGAQLATPLVPRYTEMIQTVQDRCGWDPADFHCLRLVMEHPPMPSTVVLRYELPERGA